MPQTATSTLSRAFRPDLGCVGCLVSGVSAGRRWRRGGWWRGRWWRRVWGPDRRRWAGLHGAWQCAGSLCGGWRRSRWTPRLYGLAYDARALLVPRLRRADRRRSGLEPCLVFDPVRFFPGVLQPRRWQRPAPVPEPRAFRRVPQAVLRHGDRWMAAPHPRRAEGLLQRGRAVAADRARIRSESPDSGELQRQQPARLGHLSGWTQRDLHLPPRR